MLKQPRTKKLKKSRKLVEATLSPTPHCTPPCVVCAPTTCHSFDLTCSQFVLICAHLTSRALSLHLLPFLLLLLLCICMPLCCWCLFTPVRPHVHLVCTYSHSFDLACPQFVPVCLCLCLLMLFLLWLPLHIHAPSHWPLVCVCPPCTCPFFL